MMFFDVLRVMPRPVAMHSRRDTRGLRMSSAGADELDIRQSRSVELVPAGTVIPPSDVENYRPQTPLLARQRVAELQRHRDRDFTDSWANLRAVHGDMMPAAPVNVLPVNIQPKNETVGRVAFDPSNAGEGHWRRMCSRMTVHRSC
jgi:hypothetical protein